MLRAEPKRAADTYVVVDPGVYRGNTTLNPRAHAWAEQSQTSTGTGTGYSIA